MYKFWHFLKNCIYHSHNWNFTKLMVSKSKFCINFEDYTWGSSNFNFGENKGEFFALKNYEVSDIYKKIWTGACARACLKVISNQVPNTVCISPKYHVDSLQKYVWIFFVFHKWGISMPPPTHIFRFRQVFPRMKCIDNKYLVNTIALTKS